MIREEKRDNAVLAIQQLVIEARVFTSQRREYEEIYDLLDEIEYLAGLLLIKDNITDTFEVFLEGICKKRGFQRIWDYYIGKRNLQ
ncbi:MULTISPECIES: GTP-binding protein EngB [Capnocytophaga]|jgi:putative GTP-binding protein engB|uniref:GTP-binding protein EngB n=1 Tax=Capnocytophaga endodontalis TaxID=2708117 RepID=A0A1Z4BMX6_9FLAO|nr:MULTISPECIES: GTP-binding protein EngB [Capnocytophaga]ASF42597.1 GTP-binding protein EngB [Capnocytophaga endodontalis]MBI1669918.1 GTP-binding protein EngB [Capnocytophaga periodontitidis]MBM0652472.1 GTP-binding protein EngB [Capnocytophaga genosp. AHN8471]